MFPHIHAYPRKGGKQNFLWGRRMNECVAQGQPQALHWSLGGPCAGTAGGSLPVAARISEVWEPVRQVEHLFVGQSHLALPPNCPDWVSQKEWAVTSSQNHQLFAGAALQVWDHKHFSRQGCMGIQGVDGGLMEIACIWPCHSWGQRWHCPSSVS